MEGVCARIEEGVHLNRSREYQVQMEEGLNLSRSRGIVLTGEEGCIEQEHSSLRIYVQLEEGVHLNRTDLAEVDPLS